MIPNVCKIESQARLEREERVVAASSPMLRGWEGPGVGENLSNIESNRVGICLGPSGSQDNYLNAGGIMESRQDFNQFHILNINE